ncbi:MAG: metal-dependent transcriptional regulator [Candidatus Coatesbacteria bacterium]|nr:MAG: metal-dependent transcriptional regulator [Candidatus Coatesbacteria bacterium]
MLSPALEDYLEAILELEPPVRVSAIARRLRVAKASVTQAVQRLVEKGLAVSPRYGRVELTARGLAAARKIRRRHRIWLEFLEEILGVPHATANREACVLEHGLSPETTARLTSYVAGLKKTRRPRKRGATSGG